MWSGRVNPWSLQSQVRFHNHIYATEQHFLLTSETKNNSLQLVPFLHCSVPTATSFNTIRWSNRFSFHTSLSSPSHHVIIYRTRPFNGWTHNCSMRSNIYVQMWSNSRIIYTSETAADTIAGTHRHQPTHIPPRKCYNLTLSIDHQVGQRKLVQMVE